MQTPSGCDISVIMTDKGSVDLYSEAGGTVVTNPDGKFADTLDDDVETSLSCSRYQRFGTPVGHNWRSRLVPLRQELLDQQRFRSTPGWIRTSDLACSTDRRIRLISHRSFGFHSAAPLIALVYLCCAGIAIDLPR